MRGEVDIITQTASVDDSCLLLLSFATVLHHDFHESRQLCRPKQGEGVGG